jgi:hypothetical protein
MTFPFYSILFLGVLAILAVCYLHFRCRPQATVQYGENVLIFTVRNAEITRVIRREGQVEVHIDRKVRLQEQRLAA